MEELADNGLIWDPDRCLQKRIVAEEAIRLEIRGLTRHDQETPPPKEVSPKQTEFWRKQSVHKHIVADKLSNAGLQLEAETLRNCHSYYTVAQCNDCHQVRKFPNRCDLFYCPECQPHLANERRRQVEWWTRTIDQPKHVVLTIKNAARLTRDSVHQLRAAFTRLRHRKFARAWKGGFYSLELTNEGNGWHLHLHVLVDAYWIDQPELSKQWEQCTRGLGYIVKVKDARQTNYLAEVTKYAVKGVQLASWSPEQIRDFVRAFDGVRCFGVFGSLYSARTEFAEFVASLKSAKPKCDCGSCNVSYYTECEWLERLHFNPVAHSNAPPVRTERQVELLPEQPRWPD